MRDWILWLNETSASVALRESLYLWPILEATHVLTIMLFVGTIVMVDLRLLGLAFTRVSVSEMTARILPWTIAGFILMVITGVALFYAKPLTYYHNVFFRLKLILMVLALVNIVLFHRGIQRNVPAWDRHGTPPVAARASAFVSLSVWIGVVIAGRMIAYDWYECRKLDPGRWLSAFAGCPTVETAWSDDPADRVRTARAVGER